MRLFVSSFAVVLLVAAAAHGQTAPLGALTLEQVLQLAEQHGEPIAIAQAGIRRAQADEGRARSGLYPQVTASVSYDRALASEFDGVFDNVDFGGGSNGDQGDGTSDDGLGDLPFGRKNTWRLNLNLSQNLFDWGRIAAQRRLAAVGRESAEITLTTSRAQLFFDVTQAYYNAALSGRLVAIAEATLGQAAATLQQTEAAFRAGTQPEFDVLRARVSRDTQNPNVIRARVNREIALLRLKQLLDLPPGVDLQLADALADDVLPPAPVFASRVVKVESQLTDAQAAQVMLESPLPITDRAAVKDVATTVSLQEAALASVKAQRMPRLSLTTSYGRVGYPANIVVPELNRLNWTVGVNMQVPILTGGRQRGDERVAEAELEQAQVRLRQVQELADLDSRSAIAELVAARATWQATAGTVQEANRAYELAGIRYEAGVSTQLELSDSRLVLQQAEVSRAQAARDLQVARARVALLPDLPLGTTGTTSQPFTQPQLLPPPTPSAPQSLPQNGGGQIRNASVQGAGQQFGGQ
jgi:outer membrane protein TolC